jgi:hypothetical protein
MKRSVGFLALSYWPQPIRSIVLATCMLFFLFSLGYGADFTGNWSGYISSYSDGSTLPVSVLLRQSGSNLTGTVTLELEEEGLPDLYLPFSGSVTGNMVSSTGSISYPGVVFQFEMHGTLSGDTINGVYNLYAEVEGEEFFDTGSFTLTRPTTTYLLSVTKSGTGSGTVTSSPSGINCGTSCSASFNTATVVTLTATPDTSSSFAGWTGCDAVNGNVCAVTMNAAKSVTGLFTSQTMAAAGSFLYGDFGSGGIWKYDGAWSKIAASNPQTMVAANSFLYGDFSPDGIWKYDGAWGKITASNP